MNGFTQIMVYVLFTAGILGMLGMTWLFPLLALLPRSKRQSSREKEEDRSPSKISIILPACNEEYNIGRSLSSIYEAIATVQKVHHSLQFDVIVGADGCCDRTAAVAHEYGASTLIHQKSQGKWKTLLALIGKSGESDWIIFADSGTLWPRNLLLDTFPSLSRYNVIGIAPSYSNPTGGFLEQLQWAFERHIKGIESRSGGPVSIHGATVMYRRRELLEALSTLKNRDWLNDDVVLPLVLRTLNPDKCIQYLKELAVEESPECIRDANHSGKEFYRRKRIVLGNIQWMASLIGMIWKSRPHIGMLAMRRICRVFWIYWVVFFVGGFFLTTQPLFLSRGILHGIPFSELEASVFPLLTFCVTFGMIFYMLLFTGLRKFFEAALASFLAPFYLFFTLRPEFSFGKARWK